MTQYQDTESRMTREDEQLVRVIAEAYVPAPMSRARQVAFRRGVETRLDWRTRFLPLPVFAIAATATLALVLWFGLPRSDTADGGAAVARRVAQDPTLYAFVDVDADTDEFLPDDYLVLANALELPVDDF